MENTNDTITQAPSADEIRQAEERGYLRGLNEAAEKRMNEPALYEQIHPENRRRRPDNETEILFSNFRKSVWED